MTFDPSFMSSCTSFLTYCSALQYLEHASKCLTDCSSEDFVGALIQRLTSQSTFKLHANLHVVLCC